jgi:hypothetical protein
MRVPFIFFAFFIDPELSPEPATALFSIIFSISEQSTAHLRFSLPFSHSKQAATRNRSRSPKIGFFNPPKSAGELIGAHTTSMRERPDEEAFTPAPSYYPGEENSTEL